MKIKIFAATALAALFGMSLVPLPSNADPSCIGSECTVRFDHTGNYQVFDIPPGAKNLRFDIQGARGGRLGGLGGQVTGSLGDLSGRLYVFVGGQGLEGSSQPGGFNGGGQSGGNHADEGSGGGASDLRLTLSAQDRIVVAGGGGGTGGWSGATGGAGGGLIGANGNSGQGAGGGGGSQTTGGYAGSSNGGYLGGPGVLAQGGAGGFSSVSGGGGGGGGYYGGGGGGADVDTCCSDGGGGGGGSSFAYGQAQNVVHTQGVNAGHGFVILSYSMPPEVSVFTLEQTATNAALANLVFSTEIAALPSTALSVSGSECDLEIIGSGSSYQVLLENCDSADLSLELKANSISNGILGPSEPKTASLILDQEPPQIELGFTQSYSTSTSVILAGSIIGAENSVTEESFSVHGCEGLELLSTNPVQLQLSECAQGSLEVTLKPDSLWDQWGNSAPSEALVFQIWLDSIGPEPKFSPIEVTEESALISVSEVSEGWGSQLVLELGETGCQVEILNQNVSLTQCAPGQISLTIPVAALTDEYGNLGPSMVQVFSHEFVAAPVDPPSRQETASPSPSPSPISAEIPAQPVPSSEPQPDLPPAPDVATPEVSNPEELLPEEVLAEPAISEPDQVAAIPVLVESDPEAEVEVIDQRETESINTTEFETRETEGEPQGVTDQVKPEGELEEADTLPQAPLPSTELASGPSLSQDQPSAIVWILGLVVLGSLIAGIVGYRLIEK